MKLMVTYRPKTAPPPAEMPGMFMRLAAWVEKYGPQMETLYFFAGGGGFGVIDLDDAAQMQRMMAEHPFTPYADVEIRAVVPADQALATLQEVFAGPGAGN